MDGRVERRCAAAMLLLLWASFCQAAPAPAATPVSEDVRHAANWILRAADQQRLPFAIVDKKAASIHVYDPGGRLIGASPVLLGLASGDESVSDIARRAPGSLAPGERTTPAGRFASEPGHNDQGEAIVWIDYDASLAIHRLRPAPKHERRAARMASGSPADRRISNGCIVVPVAFYETVVSPGLGRQRGFVYVLAESRPPSAMFHDDAVAMGAP